MMRTRSAPLGPMPILIGGTGERKTLRLVAKYADACNIFPGPDVAHKLDVLRRHCDDVGRDRAAIKLSVNVGMAWRPDVQDGFLRKILGHEAFRAGQYDVTFVDLVEEGVTVARQDRLGPVLEERLDRLGPEVVQANVGAIKAGTLSNSRWAE